MKSRILPIFLLAVLCAASAAVLHHISATRPGVASPTVAAGQAPVLETYGKLPLAFEVNQGQTDAQVKFLSRGSGYTLFLTGDEAVLALKKPSAGDRQRSPLRNSKFTTPNPTQRKDLRTRPTDFKLLSIDNLQSSIGNSPAPSPQPPAPSTLRLKLVGANQAARVVGADKLPGKSNYFIGKDPKRWRTNVANYAKVQYRDVYPGVDLVYYGNQGRLEHDFVVSPGADPAAIRLALDGADSLRLDEQGNLVAKFDSGNVIFQKPTVYQPAANPESRTPNPEKQSVDGRYVLLANNRIGFDVGAYDKTQALVIDPVLSFSTYLGGSDWDSGVGIAVDSTGSIYMAGYALGADFPILNSVQPYGGGGDAVVVKLNLTPTPTLLYSTFLGGSGREEAYAIAVDSAGEACISGFTNSADLPTVNPIQPTFGGAEDVFAAKLNAGGSALVYSTYIGGSLYESTIATAVDSAGSQYVTGYTSSTDFPVVNPLQATLGGADDAFLVKIDPSGSSAIYSTYLGGSDSDSGTGIAVDSLGSAYFTGSTKSADFPTLLPYQATRHGTYDAFVVKVKPDGSGLVFSTFLGGSSVEAGLGVALSSAGNLYVTGFTGSSDYPLANALQDTMGGGSYDAFVTEFSPDGQSLVFSTFLGGQGHNDTGYGIGLDAAGNVFVAGITNSTDFPTANPLQALLSGPTDAFVSKLNPSGTALIHSTYFGGSDVDAAFGLAVDALGNAYITGATSSTDLPTANPLQTDFAGTRDAFIAKVNLGPAADVALTPPSMDFGKQTVGTSSSAKSARLLNDTGSSQGVASIDITGPNANDFSQTSTCGASLATGMFCTVDITFTPTGPGSRTATLEVAAGSSTHTVALSGTGADFSLSADPTSRTVTAGQPATYTLSVTPAGRFNSAVSLACSGVPSRATCKVSPASVTPDGTNAATATVSVTTTASSLAPPGTRFQLPPPGKHSPLPFALGLLLATFAVAALTRRRLPWVLVLSMLCVVLWAACGGGGGGGGGNPGTPKGDYTLSITATSGSLSHNTTLTLKVN